MTFEGHWEQVSGENRDKILEILECPKEFIEKIVSGPKLSLCVKKDGDGLLWEIKVGDFSIKTEMKQGQEHPVGQHSPNYKAKPTKITDTLLEEDVLDNSGTKHGSIRAEVTGDQLTSVTTVKDVTSTSTFKRVK